MLHKELEKFAVFAEGRLLESKEIANKAFSDEARRELAVVAESLGATYSDDRPVFEWVVTKKGSKFMSAPQIMNKDGQAVVVFGGYHYPLALKDSVVLDDVEHSVVHIVNVSDSGNSYFLEIEVDDHPSISVRIRTKPNTQISKSKMMSAFKKGIYKEILPYLHEDSTILSVSDLPAEFTIFSAESITTQDNRIIAILSIDDGKKFWSPKGAENLTFPARAFRHDTTLEIETPQGLQTFELSSFGKLKDLEPGEYKVTAWQVTNGKFGESINIKIGGKYYNANTAIKKSLSVLQPKLSDETPGILTIEGKEQMTNGNVKVVCRFTPPVDYEDPAFRAFMNIEEAAVVW